MMKNQFWSVYHSPIHKNIDVMMSTSLFSFNGTLNIGCLFDFQFHFTLNGKWLELWFHIQMSSNVNGFYHWIWWFVCYVCALVNCGMYQTFSNKFRYSLHLWLAQIVCYFQFVQMSEFSVFIQQIHSRIHLEYKSVFEVMLCLFWQMKLNTIQSNVFLWFDRFEGHRTKY